METEIRIHAYGEPSELRFEEVNETSPGKNQVKVKQEAVGVNFFDTMVRRGEVKFPLPVTLGVEGAGVIESVGAGVEDFSVGDRVAYFFSMGGYATKRLIDPESLVHLPPDITSTQAATFMAKGLTAWMGLHALHTIMPGEVALVQGASGSVGAILSRWAKKSGATVIGVAGSEQKMNKVESGANHALYSHDPNFSEKVHTIARDGVDVVFDFVGAATAQQSFAAVRSGGKIVSIGAASGNPLPESEELNRRGVEVVGGGTPQYVNSTTISESSAQLFQAIRDGLFDDIGTASYRFTDAVKVHTEMAQRKLNGLPVLVV
jgi:NADPH2:quinone reductase